MSFFNQNNESPGGTGEKVFQMLWDCRFCGTPKLLGLDHRHCPNCGAAQDPEWRYFPSDADMKLVTDPGYAYAGTDRVCPFCGQPNSAAAKFCKECGGDLSGAKGAATQDGASSGLEGVTGDRPDVVLNKFQKEQAAIKVAEGGGRKGISRGQAILIAIVALAVVLIGGLITLSNSRYTTTLAVSGMSWERVITVERYERTPGSGWRDSMPAGANTISCEIRQRAYNETERYVCGREYRDRGDGSGSYVDKYCTRNKTVYRSESWCSYYVDSWNFNRNIKASGGPDDPLIWPNFSPVQTFGLGAERERSRTETLTVLFKEIDNNENHTYNPKAESAWRDFNIGQKYSVEINRLEQEQWNTLKRVSGE